MSTTKRGKSVFDRRIYIYFAAGCFGIIILLRLIKKKWDDISEENILLYLASIKD